MLYFFIGDRVSFKVVLKNDKMDAKNVTFLSPGKEDAVMKKLEREDNSRDDASSHSMKMEEPPPAVPAAPLQPAPTLPVNAKIIDDVYQVEVDRNGELVTHKRKERREPEEHKQKSPAKEDPLESWLQRYQPELAEYLKEFSAREEKKLFERTTYPCGVCFDDKVGAQCLKFRGK